MLSRLHGFLVASAALLGVAILAAGLLVGRFFEWHVLAHEEAHTAEVVLNQARQHLTARDFETPAGGAAFRAFLEGLPGVFRIKAFDRSGRIVWSNEPRVIGMAFPDNPHFQAALKGRVSTELEAPDGPEHTFERDHRYVAEAYTPVAFADRAEPVGVIETYKDVTALVAGIHETRRRVWEIAGAAGFVVWAALALVAWRASAGELRAIRRLEDWNAELVLLQRFTQSVLRPLDLQQLARSVVESAAAGLPLRAAALYRVDAGQAVPLAAWPTGGAPGAPPELVDAALAGRRRLIRGNLLAVPLVTLQGTRHLFLGDLGQPAAVVAPDLRTLEIMLDEAAIALGNLELFTEIRMAHERLAAIVAGIADRMVIIDRDLRVVWMNAAAGAAGGALGRPYFEVGAEGAKGYEACPAVRSLVSGTVERGMRAERGGDGRTRYLDLIAAPLKEASGAVYQVLEVARDITELVEMEERLKHSNHALIETEARLIEKERLAAIGQVVVGLHHAILNPLTGALGALEVLKQAAGDDAARHLIGEAEAQIHKIERVVRALPDLRHAETSPYVGSTTMLDLGRQTGGEETSSGPAAPDR